MKKFKPIHRHEIKRAGYTRIPYYEPLTPGLRKKEISTSAVGFTVDLLSNERRHDEALDKLTKK